MRKGSSRAHADWPRLRRRLTPGASEVGTASMTGCSVREFMMDPRKMAKWGRGGSASRSAAGEDDPRQAIAMAQRMSSDEPRIDRTLRNARDALVTTLIPAHWQQAEFGVFLLRQRVGKIEPAALGHPCEQVFHLIGEDASIAQDEMLMTVRHVGYVEQWHARLLQRAATFGGIAAPARGNSVGPHITPASRNRHHMVTGKIAQHETRAAIRAQLPIACEQQRVGQARRVSVPRCAAALDRQ